MRILMLNYEFPPLGGGASPVSYQIAKGYAERGHSVTVVTMGYRNLPEYETKDGIRIFRVRCLRSRKEICKLHEMLSYIISALIFLNKHLKKQRYDINHTHFIIPTGILSLWAKKRFGLRYIITSHGSDVPGFNSDRFRFIHLFTSGIIRTVMKNAELITTPSEYLKRLIVSSTRKHFRNKIKVIPNGSEDFRRRSYSKENIIFSSGRLLKRKGFHFLIHAFKRIKDKDWKLYIIGNGPEIRQLKKISRNNGNIVFTGWLNNKSQEYLEICNKAKIFVLLSGSESQGIVYIEAMSTSCAIVASDNTACRETVSRDTGFLVRRSNINQISEALRTLMNNKIILKEKMKNSRKRFENLFDYSVVNEKYDKIINNYKSVRTGNM